MAADFRPWEGAMSCTGRVTLGAKSMLAWLVANAELGWSGGILNCRLPSLHSEGRALDWMLPVTDAGKKVGYAIIRLLLGKAWELGIQCIIYDRTIWSARSPQGRPYTGAHPHYDHIHIEWAWVGANNLDLAIIVSLIGGVAEKPAETTPAPAPAPAPKPTPAPAPTTSWEEALVNKLPLVSVKHNQRGAHVKRVQSLLAANGFPPMRTFRADGQPDGIFGTNSDSAVKRFQRAKSLAPDGVVGKNTWTRLIGG